MRYCLAVLILAGSTLAQTTTSSPCKVTFSVVRKDEAGALLNGFRLKTLEWFQKKMTKKYPDVCYSADPDSTSYVLFFSASPAVYHGVRTYTSSDTSKSPVSGTVTNDSGERVGTIDGTVDTTTTTTSEVPYEVNYDKLYLAVEYKVSSGWKPIESFNGKTLQPALAGVICLRNCHPTNSMIEEAVKYLHAIGAGR